MHDALTLSPSELDRFIQRSKASSALPEVPEVAPLLLETLRQAAAVVPSEAGRILLDDPLSKVAEPRRNDLYTVAAFGPGAAAAMGGAIPATTEVAGRVYRTGRCLSTTVGRNTAAAAEAEPLTGRPPRSLIAAPIILGGSVCGALELFNRLEQDHYDARDLLLAEVFAGEISSIIQNTLDARHALDLAKVDDLTGLYNDRYLHVRLREELEAARAAGSACALLFLDLDHFKPINDTFGHLVGSQVLRETGYLLRRIMADDATAVLARYGGDEFTILLPGRTADEAAEIAERVRTGIEAAVFLDRDRGPDLPALRIRRAVTVSIGVADTISLDPENGDTARTLLRLADEAMYAAKAAGKNRVVRVSPVA